MLISFHEPDNDRNQVLYCRLGNGDRALIDRFVQKYVSSGYPPKTFDYKGEDIIIYPMADGDFLACYLTEDFLVLSCQKKLIEEVIDIRKPASRWLPTLLLKKCGRRRKVRLLLPSTLVWQG